VEESGSNAMRLTRGDLKETAWMVFRSLRDAKARISYTPARRSRYSLRLSRLQAIEPQKQNNFPRPTRPRYLPPTPPEHTP